VVCGNGAYSARDKRLSAVWLAYPLATPTRPRVIASIPQPKDVSSLSPPTTVEWTNAAGTEMIGSWNPTVVTAPGGDKTWTTTNYNGFVRGGKVQPFTKIFDPVLAW